MNQEIEIGSKDKEEERRKRIFASESSHWYWPNTAPHHEVLKVKKRKGDPDEYRPTNISDARKLGLLPSVTNLIGKYSNKAGIEIWKRDILLTSITKDHARDIYAALDNDQLEERDKVLKQIADAADKETGKYAELGTLVHGCLEKGIQKIIGGYDIGVVLVMVKEMVRDTGYEESAGRITEIIGLLHQARIIFEDVTVIQEKGFAFNIQLPEGINFGLAGKVDMLIEYSADDVLSGRLPVLDEFQGFRVLARQRAEKGLPTRLLLDFKTRKPNRLKNGGVSFPSYPSDVAQLAGYSEGAKYAAGFKPDMCCNVLIASDAIRDLDLSCHVKFREHSQADTAKAMDILKAMAGMWVAEERLSQEKPYIPHLPEEI